MTAVGMALMTADAVSAIVLFVAAAAFRFGEADWLVAWAPSGVDGRTLAVLYGIGWVAALWITGMYRPRVRWTVRGEALDLLRAVALLAVTLLALLFWFKLPNVSRQFLVILFPSQFVLSLTSRVVLRRIFAAIRARGMNSRFVLVVGAGAEGRRFADMIETHPELGLRVVGHLIPAAGPSASAGVADSTAPDTLGLGRPTLGTIDQIEEVLHSRVIDEVAICLPPDQAALIEPITRLCEEEGRIVRIPLEGPALTMQGSTIEDFDDIRVMSLVYGPDRVVGLVAKRVFDVAIATVGLILLSPVLAVIAIWVRIGDGSPAVFRQTRVGLQGRPFEMIKFRTMEIDAEARLADVEGLNEINGPAFKLTDDPRVSPTGRFLRRFSLDELPQLWNVLRGEMSIVGPRPPLPSEVVNYDIWHRRRLTMKPGMTGLWQVAARREAEFDRWVRMDLEYIDRWSLWLDVKIILRTIPAVLTQQGR
jgi:exopolysaccharide biosynthesis polyprenyl glycosylphosphotransferase